MTLENTDISARYKDVVQLEKSGLGLPSHAGKEAAVYDGSGAQILGRTAVRHWLDPHPDAASFAETWEFSATGDMTQAALETAGWAFDVGTSGSVSGGVLKITNNGAGLEGVRLTCSFDGDFDVIAAPLDVMENTAAESSFVRPMFGIGDADGTGWPLVF